MALLRIKKNAHVHEDKLLHRIPGGMQTASRPEAPGVNRIRRVPGVRKIWIQIPNPLLHLSVSVLGQGM